MLLCDHGGDREGTDVQIYFALSEWSGARKLADKANFRKSVSKKTREKENLDKQEKTQKIKEIKQNKIQRNTKTNIGDVWPSYERQSNN